LSAMWEVQVAIYEQLKNNATLMALIDGIYDEPETNNAYPYITIGDGVESPDDSHSTLGYEDYLTFVIYTKPAGLGSYTAKNILAKMNDVINTKKFSMTSKNMLICEFDNATPFRNKDIRGLIVRYKVITEEQTNFTI